VRGEKGLRQAGTGSPTNRRIRAFACLQPVDHRREDPGAEAVKLQATHVGLRFNTVTRPLVNTFHKAHLTVFVYTVNRPADITKMKTFGVDGIISDFRNRL